MEKDIGKIPKNPDTDIVIRVDDFGGKVGLTIREFVKSERYTGFTKSGVRIPSEEFKKFKEMINSIKESDMASDVKPKEDEYIETEESSDEEQEDLPDY